MAKLKYPLQASSNRQSQFSPAASSTTFPINKTSNRTFNVPLLVKTHGGKQQCVSRTYSALSISSEQINVSTAAVVARSSACK